MASTYSDLKFQLMATGENSTTWGNVTNTNLGTAIEEAITGSVDVTFASGNVTLSLSNTNATQPARNLRLNCIGTTGGPRNLVLGSGCQIDKVYIVNNNCADTITIKNTTGTGVAIPAGKTTYVFNDGTNVVDAITHLSSLTLGSALSIASGGTGSSTATFSGENITSLNASNISTGTLANAQTTASSSNGASTIVARDASGNFSANTISAALNGVAASAIKATGVAGGAANQIVYNTALDTSNFIVAPTTGQTYLRWNGTGFDWSSVGTGNGTVTSVNVTAPAFLTATGGPITTSGTIALSYSGTAIPVSSGGTGINTTSPAYGVLAAGTTPTNPFQNIGTGTNGQVLTSNGAGVLPSFQNSSAGTVTQVNGTGTANGLSLTGTVTSTGSLTLGGAINASTITTGVLSVASGGTGSSNAAFNGANITNLNASNIDSGTIANARTTATPSNFANTIVARDASGNFSAGTITATLNGGASSLATSRNFSISGGATASAVGFNGSSDVNLNVTGINASSINSGTVPVARLAASGSPSSSTFLRGDSSWASLGTLTFGAELSAETNLCSGPDTFVDLKAPSGSVLTGVAVYPTGGACGRMGNPFRIYYRSISIS